MRRATTPKAKEENVTATYSERSPMRWGDIRYETDELKFHSATPAALLAWAQATFLDAASVVDVRRSPAQSTSWRSDSISFVVVDMAGRRHDMRMAWPNKYWHDVLEDEQYRIGLALSHSPRQ